jgi:hypothetical protein
LELALDGDSWVLSRKQYVSFRKRLGIANQVGRRFLEVLPGDGRASIARLRPGAKESDSQLQILAFVKCFVESAALFQQFARQGRITENAVRDLPFKLRISPALDIKRSDFAIEAFCCKAARAVRTQKQSTKGDAPAGLRVRSYVSGDETRVGEHIVIEEQDQIRSRGPKTSVAGC